MTLGEKDGKTLQQGGNTVRFGQCGEAVDFAAQEGPFNESNCSFSSSNINFNDADVMLVVPPLEFGGRIIEYCTQLLSGEISKDVYYLSRDGEVSNDKSEEQKAGSEDAETAGHLAVSNGRLSLLQGELLDVALIILPRAQSPEEVTEKWFQKYMHLKTSADLLVITPPVPSYGDGRRSTSNQGGKTVSKTPPRRISVLSSQLWESQAFPVDTVDGVQVTLHQLQQPRPAVLFAYEIPFTVNSKHLEWPLLLQITVSNPITEVSMIDVPKPSTQFLSPKNVVTNPGTDNTTTDITRSQKCTQIAPVDGFNSLLYSESIYNTEYFQQLLSTPTPYISTIPYSSALTGGLYSSKIPSQQQLLAEGDAAGRVITHRQRGWQTDLSDNIKMLDLAIARPAHILRDDYPNTSSISGILQCPKFDESESYAQVVVEILKPLELSTMLIDSLICMLVENITEEVPITIETIDMRSVGSYTQSQLPFELQPGEQYCVLIRLDESPSVSGLNNSVSSWDSVRTQTATQGGGTPHSTKKVLPLCLKWRISGNNSPSVWSQFGADCHLPIRTPIEILLTCHSVGHPGEVLTTTLTVVNHETQEVDLNAFLPKDLQYIRKHLPSSSHPSTEASSEPPPLIPLFTRQALGRIPPNSSLSTFLQFIPTRVGVYSFPPIMVIDTTCNRRFVAKGGEVVVRLE